MTEDDKTKLALEVAQRGVYTAKDESEDLLKPLELAVGGIISRAPPGAALGVSAGPTASAFPSSIDSAAPRRPRSSGVHAGPANGMGVKRERSRDRHEERHTGSRRPYVTAATSALGRSTNGGRERQWVNAGPNNFAPGPSPPPNGPLPNGNADVSSSSSMSLASGSIPALPPPPRRPTYTSSRTEPRMLGPTAITNLLTEMKGKTDISTHDERFGLIRLDDEHTYYGDPPDPFSEHDLQQHAMSDGVKTSCKYSGDLARPI